MNHYSRPSHTSPITPRVASGYNGWTNYETWCVNLWLTNDQGLYTSTRELIGAASTTYEAAESLKTTVHDTNPLADEASLFSDLLNGALSEVDWVEIVETFRDE